MDDRKRFATELREVRPSTRDLITSVMLDTWPNLAAIVDFGLETQEQYEALYYPLRQGEISPKELDAALGDGKKLTELARQSPSNPHKDVEFYTSWDLMLEQRQDAHLEGAYDADQEPESDWEIEP